MTETSETPILDMQKPLPRNIWSSGDPLRARDYFIIVGFFLGFGAAILGGLIEFPARDSWVGRLDQFLPVPPANAAAYGAYLYFPLIVMAIGLAVVVHECGHIIGGKIAGYRFRYVIVFPLRLTWKPLRLQLLRRSEYIGAVSFDFSDAADFRRRYGLTIAGGPIANLVSAAAFYPIWRAASPELRGPLGWFVGYSLFLGLVNLIPIHRTSHSTDGSKLVMLAFQPERCKRFQAMLHLNGLAERGITSKHWPAEIVEQAISSGAEKSPEKYTLFWFGYVWYSQHNDARQVGLCLERCLEALSSGNAAAREQMKVEASLFHAWHRGNPAAAEAWYHRIEKPKRVAAMNRVRVAVAMACSRGQYEEALAAARKTIEGIEKWQPSTLRDLFLESWRDWLAKIEARAAQAAHA